jgi:hypothetical protein
MVDTWAGAETGRRLRVAPVVLRTTTISSGAGGGAAVSAHAHRAAAERTSLRRTDIEAGILEDQTAESEPPVTRDSEAEAQTSEEPSAPARKTHHLVVGFVEQVLHSNGGGKPASAGPLA